MTTEPTPDPAAPTPTVDVSFRAMDFHIEVSVSHARAHLPELLDNVRDGGVVYLTRYGKRLAALVPTDAAEYLDRLEDDYWSKRADTVLSSNPTFVPLAQAVAGWESQDS
ncbi:MAG TPA: type II toxin-antitoxin system prevent-host-death family antitoxin [Pseudonocardiaceae bacterium]|nr:type II toxin-antitoxin system prevent-host-death family antitoxin [Pseudonocardiaceae bacterium]